MRVQRVEDEGATVGCAGRAASPKHANLGDDGPHTLARAKVAVDQPFARIGTIGVGRDGLAERLMRELRGCEWRALARSPNRKPGRFQRTSLNAGQGIPPEVERHITDGGGWHLPLPSAPVVRPSTTPATRAHPAVAG